MSDPTPDPIDAAYAEAEAAMSDETARAARRARVLAAVAGAPAQVSPLPRRPSVWRRGSWLVAASVAGLALLLATQIDRPTPFRPQSPTTTSGTPILAPPAKPAAPEKSAPPRTSAPPAPPRLAPRLASPPVKLPAPPPPAAIPLALPAPEAPPPAPPPAASEQAAAAPVTNQPASPTGGVDNNDATVVSEIVVAADKRQEHIEKVPVAVSAFTSSKRDLVPRELAERGARLRAAAAAGDTTELESLLDQGVPIDVPDAAGDTALIKSVEADQPAAAALLRQRGASLEHKNHAGQSAGDLAKAKGDAALEGALGLSP